MSHRTFPTGDSIEARQHLLDNRCERLHPKRHRTSKRAGTLAKAKRARVAAKNAAALVNLRRLKRATRAYWMGVTDAHPSA